MILGKSVLREASHVSANVMVGTGSNSLSFSRPLSSNSFSKWANISLEVPDSRHANLMDLLRCRFILPYKRQPILVGRFLLLLSIQSFRLKKW